MNPVTLHAPLALLRDGWCRNVRVVLADDGHIARVERDVRPASGDRQLHDRLLLPAPSNLHSHGFQRALAARTQVRGPGEDSFWSWRRLMYRFLDLLTPELLEAITAQAQVEMCEAGYAAVAEFHYVHHGAGGEPYANPAETSARICAAAGETGIGLTLLPVLYAAAGADGRAPEGGQRRFACTAEGYEDLWQHAQRAVEEGAPDWNIGIAPHSLRAVPRDRLAEVLAAHPTGPVHMHIAEQTAEVDEIERAWGQRPMTWLLEHHEVDPRWCLIHATHIDRAECIALAGSGAVAGLCPITEADLGDGVFPAEDFVAAGGRLGVGTDANIRIGFTAELRLLEYSQRLTTRRRNLLATADRSTGRYLLDAALAGGARALGRNSGAIEAGHLADLLAVDTSAVELHGLDEDALLDGWIFSTRGAAVGEVWSAGRLVVEQGRHVNRDAIAARFRGAIDTLLGDA